MMDRKFRAPAVPLVTVDPYFSVWSCSDNLYDDVTRHWTGKPHQLTGLCRIDGIAWRFAGKAGLVREQHPHFTRGEPQGMSQKSVTVRAVSSTYVFEGGGVSLQVDFTTPLLMDDLDLASRPVSYISFKVCSIDGGKHDVKLYVDVTGEWCVNEPLQSDTKLVWGRSDAANRYDAVYMGSYRQNILGMCGDDVRIDWGYLYLVAPYPENKESRISTIKARELFIKGLTLPAEDDARMPRDTYDDTPVLSTVLSFECIPGKPVSDFIMLAYDDIFSIEYFGEHLPAYWRRNGAQFGEMLLKAVEDYGAIMERCSGFNDALYSEAAASGGEKYADIVSLAYRQAVAAHKLTADKQGNVLFISKECFSNGCAATVDVTYPSIPMFLLYNPELVKGMLRPVFKYANGGEWPFEFAPHDVGRYPMVNGQVYRLKKEWMPSGAVDKESVADFAGMRYGIDKEESFKEQMPVEECGNMLITAAAICLMENSPGFAAENWSLLTQWAGYLMENGFDPGFQLCTDDFTEKLAHNSNLSLKAIFGIAGYSILCRMMNDSPKAEMYLQTARDMAAKWEKLAGEGDHYKLTFTDSDTWSLKYNMVWDDIFGLGLFSDAVKQKEASYYIKMMDKYGTPLDSRDHSTKSDWLVWAATLARNDSDFEALIGPLWDFLNDSPSRVPFTDRYGTTDRLERSMHHRSVVGGVFMKLLKDRRSR